MQFILKLNQRWAMEAIHKQLEGNYGDLSMQKYSSNVVEKCLLFAYGGQLPKIMHELINDPQFGKIMQDPYGNYVIQTALGNTEVRAKISLFFLVIVFIYEECVTPSIVKRCS